MRYFFNIHDGKDIVDDIGMELPDIDAARLEALRFSGGIIRDAGFEFWSEHEWKMIVSDEAGRELLVLCFSTRQHGA